MLRKAALGLLLIVIAVVALVVYVTARHIVFWSPAERVSFPSGDVELVGTLIKPEKSGVYPAVIILHGSGPEELTDPAIRTTANTLVRSGFAVLIYDKRGVGKSGGDFDAATILDFADDAVAAVRFLTRRDDIDSGLIGLYGVSESGWFTPEVAVRTGDVAFIFNKVGSPLSWIDTVRWEVRNDSLAAGVAESDVDRLVDFTVRRWRYYVAAAADPDLGSGEERDSLAKELVNLRHEVPVADAVLPERLLPYDAEEYSDFAADASYDPLPFLNQLDIPIHYAFAGIDINIPTEAGVAVLERLIEGQAKKIDITVYPNVGHSLFTLRGVVNGGFVPGYLETLSAWTGAQAGIE